MITYELNAKRLLCPMPVIKVQQQIKHLLTGDILTVYCTDPGALHDIPAWCRVHGHTATLISQAPNDYIIQVQVGE